MPAESLGFLGFMENLATGGVGWPAANDGGATPRGLHDDFEGRVRRRGRRLAPLRLLPRLFLRRVAGRR